jgi:hypothetical protein
VLAAAVFAAAAVAQTPQGEPQPASPQADQPAAQAGPNPPAAEGGQEGMPPEGAGRPMRNFPPPTNLKVLPKDLSGREVRDIMQKWAGSLGVHCDFCHVADPHKVGPNGRPRLNFPDDSKPEKKIARIMYTMTQQINMDYISKAMDLDKDNMGLPVTCGTCHRGHKMPEEFVIPREAPRGEGQGGPPAGGATAPAGAAP